MPTLRLISWNLDGLDERHLDQRTEAAVRAVLSRTPDVVFFQEVTRRSHFAHLRPWMQGVGYTVAPAGLTEISHYGCMVFVRQGLGVRAATREEFPGSEMGRSLVTVRVGWGEVELLLLTAHLESLSYGSEQRVRQLDVVLKALAAHRGPAVFAGDTNLRDREVAGKPIRDAWQQLGSPDATRYTFDTVAIPNKAGRINRARYDRIFLNDHPGWSPRGLSFLGMEAVPGTGGLFPSDHAGLEVILELLPSSLSLSQIAGR